MKKLFVGIGAILLLAASAQADTFTITGQLTGDPRVENPDNLFIDVSIVVVDDVASWTIDINSPLHPEAKLGEFYFNLLVDANLVEFSEYDPDGWEVVASPSVAGGGQAQATFNFGAEDAQGGGQAVNVTGTQDLTFLATLENGFWTECMFYEAGLWSSSDSVLGSGQMGAHLKSLTIPSDSGIITSDSGFLVGSQ